MARVSTYRVRYRITGWVEVDALSADDALDAVEAKNPLELVTDTISRLGHHVVEIDEAELNP